MNKRHAFSAVLVALACTAAASLVIGHSIDLGTRVLGSGQPLTWAIVGDLASIIGCTVSVLLGLRYAPRRTCRPAR